MKKVSISAIKQSGNLWLPTIHEESNFESFVKSVNKLDLKFIAHCRGKNTVPLIKLVTSLKKQLIIIGPEGDFTKEEISFAANYGFKNVSLGKNILRTETACIVSIAKMKFS